MTAHHSMSPDERWSAYCATLYTCEYRGNEVACSGEVGPRVEPLHAAYSDALVMICEAHLEASRRQYAEQMGVYYGGLL